MLRSFNYYGNRILIQDRFWVLLLGTIARSASKQQQQQQKPQQQGSKQATTLAATPTPRQVYQAVNMTMISMAGYFS